jgi:hypothetical protein
MLLGGIWHGAGWTMVIWGSMHGFFLICNHLWRKQGIKLPLLCSWICTFSVVVFAWVFFRAESVADAMLIIKGMVGMNGVSLPRALATNFSFLASYGLSFNGLCPLNQFNTPLVLLYLTCGFFISLALPNTMQIVSQYNATLDIPKVSETVPFLERSLRWSPSLWRSILIGFFFAAAFLFLNKKSEFLYFQF